MPTPELREFRSVVDREGIAGALSLLNSRVPHRLSGIFKLNKGEFIKVHLVDKDPQGVQLELDTVPFEDSFCQFVVRDGQFGSSSTANDSRLDGHPYQGIVGSYVGLPLINSNGDLWGTFCHLDLLDLKLPDGEFEFLQQAVRYLPTPRLP